MHQITIEKRFNDNYWCFELAKKKKNNWNNHKYNTYETAYFYPISRDHENIRLKVENETRFYINNAPNREPSETFVKPFVN